jgi:hypothetical protein
MATENFANFWLEVGNRGHMHNQVMIPLLIAGRSAHGPSSLDVLSPVDQGPVGRTSYASTDQVEEALAAADAVRPEAVRYTMADLTSERVMVLTGLDL